MGNRKVTKNISSNTNLVIYGTSLGALKKMEIREFHGGVISASDFAAQCQEIMSKDLDNLRESLLAARTSEFDDGEEEPETNGSTMRSQNTSTTESHIEGT